MENKNGFSEQGSTRREFIKEFIIALGVAVTGGRVASLLKKENKNKQNISSEKISLAVRIVSFIEEKSGQNISSEDISNYLKGLTNLEKNKPYTAYSINGNFNVIFTLKSNKEDKDELIVEVINIKDQKNIPVGKETFDLNELQKPDYPEPDWHKNPEIKREIPPTAV